MGRIAALILKYIYDTCAMFAYTNEEKKATLDNIDCECVYNIRWHRMFYILSLFFFCRFFCIVRKCLC